jgi:hypothetical protein
VNTPRHVGLVTCRTIPALTDDDQLLLPALAAHGIEGVPAVWDDPQVAWETFDCVVVRSCWDYYHRPQEFLAWLDRLDTCAARVWNPVSILRENSHKGYLRRLADAGVPTVPTAWLARGSQTVLRDLLHERGWSRAVVKPAVSAGAHKTWVVGVADADAKQAPLDELVAAGDVLVQPFLPTIETAGEWSVVFCGGSYSHAVLKHPRPGEFRVQNDFGGSARSVAASGALQAQCRRILDQIEGACLYARVDGIELEGVFTLMELELIEPALFFSTDALAASRFVDALLALAARPHP